MTFQELIEAQEAGLITNLRFETVFEEDNVHYVHAYFNPTKPVEYITLNFIGVRSNVSFEEIINDKTDL